MRDPARENSRMGKSRQRLIAQAYRHRVKPKRLTKTDLHSLQAMEKWIDPVSPDILFW